MDKRLELTAKQKELLEKLQNCLDELEKEKAIIIWDGLESYHVINGENVDGLLFPEDCGDGIVEVEHAGLPCFSLGSLDLAYTDSFFGVSFK